MTHCRPWKFSLISSESSNLLTSVNDYTPAFRKKKPIHTSLASWILDTVNIHNTSPCFPVIRWCHFFWGSKGNPSTSTAWNPLKDSIGRLHAACTGGPIPKLLGKGKKYFPREVKLVCFLKSGTRVVKYHVIAMVSFKIFSEQKRVKKERSNWH